MIKCNGSRLYLPYASVSVVGKHLVQETDEVFWGLPVLYGCVKIYFLASCIFCVPVFHAHQVLILRILKLFIYLFIVEGRIFYLFIYLFLAVLGLRFVRGLSLVAASGGHSSSRCAGLSLLRPLLLRSTGSRRAGSVVAAHGPSSSAACGIFPDQGSNPCPLHWQADSQPLRHQGSPP